MKILALDMATHTGWATNYPTFQYGRERFDRKRGESPGMRFLRFTAWLEEINRLCEPHVIVYEQAHHRGGAATAVGVGMATTLQTFAAKHDIETMAVHTGSLKKFATGKGNASKREMAVACYEQLNSHPESDDEVDAIWLLKYAESELVGEMK